jgi:putative phage-type endonuclease
MASRLKIDRDGERELTLEQVEEQYGPLHENVVRLRKLPYLRQGDTAWSQFRKDKVTAADVCQAAGRHPKKSRNALLKSKINPNIEFDWVNPPPPIAWGKKWEDYAAWEYEQRTGRKILTFGIVAHPEYPWLAASTDGVTAKENIGIEIKCPYSRQIKPDIINLPESKNELIEYYDQIQLNIEIYKFDYVDFIQYRPEIEGESPVVFSCERVDRDLTWFPKVLPKLKEFKNAYDHYVTTGEILDGWKVKERKRKELEAANTMVDMGMNPVIFDIEPDYDNAKPVKVSFDWMKIKKLVMLSEQ